MTMVLDDSASNGVAAAVRPRFFVGIGTAKSGTTWLAKYLETHPQVALAPMKEIHFFDSIYVDVQRDNLRTVNRSLRATQKIIRTYLKNPTHMAAMLRHYYGMRQYSEKDYRRFLELLSDRDLVGEFTPAYALLPDAGFEAIERTLDRPLYLLIFRNPADRFYAQMRMGRLDADPANLERPATLLSTPHFTRSDFQTTLETLDRTVDPARVLVMFYEHLFDKDRSAEECRRLCDFLGIDYVPGHTEKRVNVGRTVKKQAWNRPAIVEALGDQYRYFAQRFGDALPERWQRDIESLPSA